MHSSCDREKYLQLKKCNAHNSITCYYHEKKPQSIGKKPAHSLEHLGKGDEQKADLQEYTGGSDLPALC